MIFFFLIHFINIGTCETIQQIKLSKGEKKLLEVSNVIYEDSLLIHATNPFTLIQNQSINSTSLLLDIANHRFGLLYLFQIDQNHLQIQSPTLNFNYSINFQCQDFFSFLLPETWIALILCKNNYSLDYLIYHFKNNQSISSTLFPLTENDITFQSTGQMLYFGHKIGTENWHIDVFQYTSKELTSINVIEPKTKIFQLIQFNVYSDTPLKLFLLSKKEFYVISDIIGENHLHWQFVDQVTNPECEYTTTLKNLQEFYFIQKCGNKYYGQYNTSNKINNQTKIVNIENYFLLLDSFSLFFEDNSIPIFQISQNGKLFYFEQNRSFFYLLDNIIYEYEVRQSFKYLLSYSNSTFKEHIKVAQTIKPSKAKDIIVFYYSEISDYCQEELQTMFIQNQVLSASNSNNITYGISLNQIGFGLRIRQPNLKKIVNEFQCEIENTNYIFLIDFQVQHYGYFKQFNGIQYESLWLVQQFNNLYFGICNKKSKYIQFEIVRDFNILYRNKICLLQNVFSFQVDDIFYVLQLSQLITLDIDLKKYSNTYLNQLETCIFTSNKFQITFINEISSVYKIVDFIQDKEKIEYIAYLKRIEDSNYSYIKKITNGNVQNILHTIIYTTYIYKRIILVYQDRLENYIEIEELTIFCYSFYLQNYPSDKQLSIANNVNFSFLKERIAFLVVNEDQQQYIFVFNFNSTYLECLEDVIETNSDQFILFQEYISIVKRNQVIIHQQDKINLKVDDKFDFEYQMFKKIDVENVVIYYQSNCSKQIENNLLLINNPKQIKKLQINPIIVTNSNKININIQDLFYGYIQQVIIKDNLNISQPISESLTIELNTIYDDISFNNSILVLKNNQVFSTNKIEDIMNLHKVTLILKLSLTTTYKCLYFREFGELQISICKNNSNMLQLRIFLNFNIIEQVEIQWNGNNKIDIQYKGNNVILCPYFSIFKSSSILKQNKYQNCEIFQLDNNYRIQKQFNSEYQIAYFQNQLIYYWLSYQQCDIIINGKKSSFNFSQIISQELNVSFPFTYMITQIYLTDNNIYFSIGVKQALLIILKFDQEQNKMQIIYYLNIWDSTFYSRIIEFVENKYCILLTSNNSGEDPKLLTYYSLTNKLSKQQFPIQNYAIKQECPDYNLIKNLNDSYQYFICSGFSKPQQYIENNIFLFYSLSIMRIQHQYQIILDNNQQQQITLQACNPDTCQELIIQLNKDNYINYIIIILFSLLLQILYIFTYQNRKLKIAQL